MGQLMHAIAKSNLLQTIYSRHILGAFPTQRHFLLSYTISVWIMERNKSISTSKKERKRNSRPGRVIILSSFTVCSNREEICGVVAVRVWWGWEESSHVAEKNGRMTLLFSPQLTMDVLSVHGSPCGSLDGILWSNAHIGNDSDSRITLDLRRRMWTHYIIGYVTRLVSHYLLLQHTLIRASFFKFPPTDTY